jgi:hypothetical protein
MTEAVLAYSGDERPTLALIARIINRASGVLRIILAALPLAQPVPRALGQSPAAAAVNFVATGVRLEPAQVEVAEKPAARVREARASSFDRLWSNAWSAPTRKGWP